MNSRNELIEFLIKEAEPRLPNPADYGEEEVYIQINLSPEEWQRFQLHDPDKGMQLPFFNVLFRKQYSEGEVVGWKFVEAD